MKKKLGYGGAFLLASLSTLAFYWPHDAPTSAPKEQEAIPKTPLVVTISPPPLPSKKERSFSQKKAAANHEKAVSIAKLQGENGTTMPKLGTLHLKTNIKEILQSTAPKMAQELATLPFPEELLDSKAKALPRAPLIYPERARLERVEGFVTITYHIKSNGALSDVAVLKSSPPGYFEESALKYVATWRFSPATYRGQVVEVVGKSTIEYRLP